MTIQRYSYISKYLFISSLIFLFFGCDIIDSIIGDDSIESDYNETQISRVEVDYYIDNANYKLTNIVYGGAIPQFVYTNGAEHNGDFITDGSGVFDDDKFGSNWDGLAVLGQTISGDMVIEFLDNPRSVNVHINQSKSWNSLIVGDVLQHYLTDYAGIPFNKSYTDDYYEDTVDEYYESGSAVSKIVATFVETNDQYIDQLTSYSCGAHSYIKVKVHYK